MSQIPTNESDLLYPQEKKRYQDTQLMNLLFRRLVGPPVRVLAFLKVSGDALTSAGILAYFAGALFFLFGGSPYLSLGAYCFAFGLLAELLDGGLARLRGPSSIGHGLSKWMEQLFQLLLAPSLGLGLFAQDLIGLPLAAASVFAGAAHVGFRAGIEAVTSAHSAEDLSRYAFSTHSRSKLFALAQFLPDHERFRWWMRGARVIRENLMESSGILPIVFLSTVLSGSSEIFLFFYASIHLPAYLGFSLLRLFMLKKGGGRLVS